MTRQSRRAFTLVEILAVIVIISMLVGMLVPAVNAAREKGRRTQCLNNQREIAQGMLQYETTIGRFPGYINRLGTNPFSSDQNDRRRALSWPMVLLPHVGREDLWRICRTLKTTDPLDQVSVRMAQYVCPSAARTDTTALSYVANCGLQDLTAPFPSGVQTPDSATVAIFHNRYNYSEPGVSASRIKDGASYTLILSENLVAGTWLSTTEPELGMVFEWLDYGYPPTGSPQLSSPCREINRCRDEPLDYVHARPSSHHPGGVVVSFADGHQQFLSDRIYYLTFQHLLTPDSDQAAPINTTYSATQRPLLPAMPSDPEYIPGP